MDRQSIASSRGAGAPLCVEKRNQLCLFKKTATRSPSLFIARTFWAGVAGTALDMAKIEMERKRTEKEKVFFLFFASRSNGERASKRGGESDEEEKNEKHQKNRFEKFFGTFFSLSLSLSFPSWFFRNRPWRSTAAFFLETTFCSAFCSRR